MVIDIIDKDTKQVVGKVRMPEFELVEIADGFKTRLTGFVSSAANSSLSLPLGVFLSVEADSRLLKDALYSLIVHVPAFAFELKVGSRRLSATFVGDSLG
ncbi:hypothetical protein [Thermosulfurimonas dismutans]|uniref:hypothetical protein n=1 Tax=Thermosulfurimonas dismutans TaxID=999894 RepID=UPI00137B8248|nr:hypothetical protein [Thermosulfurimonas dismutans]